MTLVTPCYRTSILACYTWSRESNTAYSTMAPLWKNVGLGKNIVKIVEGMEILKKFV